MQIKIKYFAMLRDQTGKKEEDWTTEATNPKELYGEIQNEYQLSLTLDHLMVAVNQEYAHPETKLNENDEVVFIPPVAGG